MLDRHYGSVARYLYGCRYFHGHLTSAEYSTWSRALLHNFHPYSPRANIKQTYESPAHKFNDFVYRGNWLHNLLISASPVTTENSRTRNLPMFTTRFPVRKKRGCSEDLPSEQKSGPEHSREEYRDDVDHLNKRI